MIPCVKHHDFRLVLVLRGTIDLDIEGHFRWGTQNQRVQS